MIVGVSGKKRAGKDTVARRLVEHHDFEQLSFAEPVKQMLYALNPIADAEWHDSYMLGKSDPIRSDGIAVRVRDAVDATGWETAKDTWPEVRRLLQRLATEAGREVLGENIWVDTAMEKARAFLAHTNAPGVVFSDVRFPNEADAIRKAGGLLIRVERNGTDTADAHPSEVALDDYPHFDVILPNNSSIAALHRLVDVEVADWRRLTSDRLVNA